MSGQRTNPLMMADAAAPPSPTNALAPPMPTAPPSYRTQIAPDQRAAYEAYVAHLAQLQGRTPASVLQDEEDYDLAGAFTKNLQPDERGHLNDEFKRPNHPTFSTGSVYHGVDGNEGGEWSQPEGPDGPWTFFAGKTNVDNMGGEAGLQRYFDQREPGNTVVMPRTPPFPGY